MPGSRRQLRPELLDDPSVPDELRARSMADVERSNALLGGRRAAMRALDGLLASPDLPREVTLLDVGAGTGDLARAARKLARARSVQMRTVVLDRAPSLAVRALEGNDASLCAGALELPVRDGGVDIAMCSQLLHHFDDEDGMRLLAELHRVAGFGVVVAELRRSRLAAWGFRAVSWPLGFHPITRHDGAVSVMRGFTGPELRALVLRATGVVPVVSRSLGWRLTASWRCG